MQQLPETAPFEPRLRPLSRLWEVLTSQQYINALLAIIILYGVFMLLAPDTFNTTRNQLTIMRAAAVFLILAVGQTFIMTTGGIDISTGSTVGVVGALVGSGLQAGNVSPAMSIPLAILIGAILGGINGFNITILKVPPLLATLGTFVAYRGFTQHYMGVNLVTGLPPVIVNVGRSNILGVPIAVHIAIISALIGAFLLNRTLFGRYITAIGSNPRSAQVTRINVPLITALTYVIQGMLAGIAALVLMGRLNSASAALGEGLELIVIAGVVLGGTYLFGGRSTMFGTVLGVYLIAMLENGLIQTGAGFFIQRIILGILIIASVAVQINQKGAR